MPYRDKGIIDEDKYITIYNQYTRESMSIIVNGIYCSPNCKYLDQEIDDADQVLWSACCAFRHPSLRPRGLSWDIQRCERCIRSEKKVIDKANYEKDKENNKL